MRLELHERAGRGGLSGEHAVRGVRDDHERARQGDAEASLVRRAVPSGDSWAAKTPNRPTSAAALRSSGCERPAPEPETPRASPDRASLTAMVPSSSSQATKVLPVIARKSAIPAPLNSVQVERPDGEEDERGEVAKRYRAGLEQALRDDQDGEDGTQATIAAHSIIRRPPKPSGNPSASTKCGIECQSRRSNTRCPSTIRTARLARWSGEIEMDEDVVERRRPEVSRLDRFREAHLPAHSCA